MKIKELRDSLDDFMKCKELVEIFTSEGEGECEFPLFQPLVRGRTAFGHGRAPFCSTGSNRGARNPALHSTFLTFCPIDAFPLPADGLSVAYLSIV